MGSVVPCSYASTEGRVDRQIVTGIKNQDGQRETCAWQAGKRYRNKYSPRSMRQIIPQLEYGRLTCKCGFGMICAPGSSERKSISACPSYCTRPLTCAPHAPLSCPIATQHYTRHGAAAPSVHQRRCMHGCADGWVGVGGVSA